jgi:hypothetical protein
MSNEDIYNKWTEFINDDKYKKYLLDNETEWINKLELVKNYIDENNKRPSQIDENIELKILASWIQTQIKNYKIKKEIMSNENIYNKWAEFINHDKYEKYFIDNETEWINTFNKVKKYIDENNKKPVLTDDNNDIKILIRWIYNQQINYKSKKHIMLNEDFYNKWTNFINDEKYKIYFIDNEIEWNNNLELVKKYIDENNKRPCCKSENNKIKILGTWIQTQISNYKNKNKIMLNENIYNKWTEFINNNKYRKYFYEIEWINKLEKLKKYIDENNIRPKSNDNNNNIKELGKWFIRQTMNYKKKIMSNENIHNKWTEFINDEKYKNFCNIH